MLFDIILRKAWKETGEKIFVFQSMTKEDIRKTAATLTAAGINFKLDFMVIESR